MSKKSHTEVMNQLPVSYKEIPFALLPAVSRRKGKKVLYDWQNGHCFYCLNKVSFDFATIDHVIPKSLGGRNKLNKVMSCYKCNNDKHSDLPKVTLVKERIMYFAGQQQ